MNDFPECEQFKDVRHRYQNCRHEREGKDAAFHDRWRMAQGLPPVYPTATTGQPQQCKQRKWTLTEKAVSAATAAADIAVNGFHPLSEQQIAERMAICQACEFFDKNRCKLCGCGLTDKVSLTNKLAHPNQQCPHDPPKWGKVQ